MIKMSSHHGYIISLIVTMVEVYEICKKLITRKFLSIYINIKNYYTIFGHYTAIPTTG